MSLDRRTLLAGLALAPLAGCAGAEAPLPRTRLRAVRLDVAPLVEKGLPNWAAKVARLAEPRLAAAFADLLAPGDAAAPVVTVSIDEIRLASTGIGIGLFGDVADEDEISGRLVVAPPRAAPVTRRLTAHRAPESGPWSAPDAEDRRLADLLALWARWARREFER